MSSESGPTYVSNLLDEVDRVHHIIRSYAHSAQTSQAGLAQIRMAAGLERGLA